MADTPWFLANQIVSGKITLEDAVKQLPNKKAVRDLLAKLFTSVRTGRTMTKGYDDTFENVMDKLAGRQSQIRPADESLLRSYGMDQPSPLRKSVVEEKTCKACGRLYKSIEDEGCPTCAVKKSGTRWHTGYLE